MKEILIYSDIGEGWFEEGITGKSVKQQLDSFNGDDVTVRINSPGGDVFEGFAIYNLLNQYAGEVTTINDGLAASAASIVFMAGTNRVVANNALTMVHDPWTMSVGSSAEMRATADLLDQVKGSIIETYLSKVDKDSDQISTMMEAETWFGASDAVEMKFATETAEGGQIVANLNKAWIHNQPKPEQIESTGDPVAWRVACKKRRLKLI